MGDDAATKHRGEEPPRIKKEQPRALRLEAHRRALDVPDRSVLAANVDAGAAAHAGGEGFAGANRLLVDGHRRAIVLAQQAAGPAFFFVDPYLKDAGPAEDRLEGAERAEESALGAPLGKERQHNHQP